MSRLNGTLIIGTIIFLVVAGPASWLTTYICWDGQLPTGEWSILVVDENAQPLSNASVTLETFEGKPIIYHAGESGCFDNYTGPGCVISGPDGIV